MVHFVPKPANYVQFVFLVDNSFWQKVESYLDTFKTSVGPNKVTISPLEVKKKIGSQIPEISNDGSILVIVFLLKKEINSDDAFFSNIKKNHQSPVYFLFMGYDTLSFGTLIKYSNSTNGGTSVTIGSTVLDAYDNPCDDDGLEEFFSKLKNIKLSPQEEVSSFSSDNTTKNVQISALLEAQNQAFEQAFQASNQNVAQRFAVEEKHSKKSTKKIMDIQKEQEKRELTDLTQRENILSSEEAQLKEKIDELKKNNSSILKKLKELNSKKTSLDNQFLQLNLKISNKPHKKKNSH